MILKYFLEFYLFYIFLFNNILFNNNQLLIKKSNKQRKSINSRDKENTKSSTETEREGFEPSVRKFRTTD